MSDLQSDSSQLDVSKRVTQGQAASVNAIEQAVQRFFTPHAYERNAREQEIMQKGSPLKLHSQLAATVWGQGPPVILFHGWEGRGTQLRSFVEPLVAAERRVIALDGPAHGDSPGTEANPWSFAQALLRVQEELGPFDAIIAHSMGAGASVIALDHGLSVRRLVLIAGPSSLRGVLKRFADAIGLDSQLFPAFLAAVDEHVGAPLSELDVLAMTPEQRPAVLLLHDPEDREVPFSDGAARAASWPGAQLRSISGVGHRRILHEPAVVREAVNFITVEDHSGAPSV